MSKLNRGSGLIEVVVGLAIVSTGAFSLIKTYNYYVKFALSHRYDVQTALLAEEGVEAVKILRDNSWAGNIQTLTTGTNYGLDFTGGTWVSTTSLKYLDGNFFRTFSLAEVYRGGDDKIADSGTLDIKTKKLTVSVSVRNIFGTTTKSISTYIADIFDN